MSRPRVVAIVPSAGFGRRLKLKTKKPFVLVKGKPLISYTIKALESCGAIDSIIIASEHSCVDLFRSLVRKFRFKKVAGIVVGGSTRFESVRNCLAEVSPEFDIVVIHDGARPFIDNKTIEESVRMAAKYGAAVVAVPESDTVKIAGRGLFINKTLDRNCIFRAQTPQVFRRGVIMDAYKKVPGGRATDDSSLVERCGKKVKIVVGSYGNIKITTREDLKLAEVLL